MSNDAAAGTQTEQSGAVPLSSLGLIGAIARALDERTKSVIAPKKDAPKVPLLKGFAENQQSDLIVQIRGQNVGKYKVALTQDRFVVDPDNAAAFEAYAEEKGEIDIVITPKPSFVDAVCKRAEVDPETGDVFDSETGEIVPGLKFVPGGQPTGTVTFTWETRKRQPVGKALLLAAWQAGELDALLRETPELLAGPTPAAENA
jgi:hypothetical protein